VLAEDPHQVDPGKTWYIKIYRTVTAARLCTRHERRFE